MKETNQVAAHTPGPWRQEYEHIYAGETVLIAEVLTDESNLPDGRLIAAAPEMLEALELALPRMLGPDRDAVMAAIQKARSAK